MVKTGQWHQTIKTVWRVKPPIPFGGSSKWLVAALLLTGCADSELDQVRVAYTRHMTMAPVLIAEAEGFFEDEGIAVELLPLESAAIGMPSLLQGRVDVLPGPVSTALFNAIHRDGRVRIVADKGAYDGMGCTHQGLVISIAGTAGEDPPIIERLGTANEHFLQFFVERALQVSGYDPETIEFMHVPQAAEYDAIRAGRLDAAFIGEPWYSRALADGGRVAVRANDLFDGYQYSVVLYGPSMLDADSDLGDRFAVALLRGLRAYGEGKTDRNLDILSELIGQERSALTEFCWPRMGPDGVIDIPSIMEFQEWAVARGDQDAIVPPETFWDAGFVERANQILDAR